MNFMTDDEMAEFNAAMALAFIEPEMLITSFRGEYAFLSNFFPAPVMLDGQEYPTVEHAYQAAKTTEAVWRKAICSQRTPGKAKRLGRQAPLRPFWNSMRVRIMRDLLDQKFAFGSELGNKLMDLEEYSIIELNTWGDTFWGVIIAPDGIHTGKNWLGQLLMEKAFNLRFVEAPE